MNCKKKLIWAICTAVCAGTLAVGTPAAPAEASWQVDVSASQQERWAEKSMGKYMLVTPSTEREHDIYDYCFAVEKRLASANGLEIVEAPFTASQDYKTKIHPLKLIEDGDGISYSIGAGYILINTHIYPSSGNVYFDDFLIIEQITAHEMTHSVGGGSLPRMGFMIAFRGGHESRKEEARAERGSVKMMSPLPEGGWGAYLQAADRRYSYGISNNDKYLRAFYAISEDMAKDAGGKVDIPREKQPPYSIAYVDKDGATYPFEAGETQSILSRDKYMGGQVAECIAAGAFRPENLKVVDKESLPSSGIFPGDSVLICKSPLLTNGWRALAFLYNGSPQEYESHLNEARDKYRYTRLKDCDYDALLQNLRAGSLDVSVQRNYSLIDEVCLMASDNALFR